MREEEWMGSTDPFVMLKYAQNCGLFSGRKLRLFGAGCCRRHWQLIEDKASRTAIETVELFADGLIDSEKLDWAQGAAVKVVRRGMGRTADALANAAWCICHQSALCAIDYCMNHLRGQDPPDHATYASLLRCICGNPFRPWLESESAWEQAKQRGALSWMWVGVRERWLSWRDGTIGWLAQEIYESRNYRNLPALADLLEAASCSAVDLLSHCRESTIHARGCWVLDVLLDKERQRADLVEERERWYIHYWRAPNDQVEGFVDSGTYVGSSPFGGPESISEPFATCVDAETELRAMRRDGFEKSQSRRMIARAMRLSPVIRPKRRGIDLESGDELRF